MSELQKVIEAVARRVATVAIIAGDVSSVDRDGLAIDVKPVDGSAPFLGVSLRAALDGGSTAVIQVPTVGSRVVVGVLGNAQAVLLVATAVTEVLIEVDGGAYLKLEPQAMRLDATAIEIGSVDLQPAVRGTALESRLNDILSQMGDILNALSAFATAMASAAGAPPLTPLVAPATTLTAALLPITTQIATTIGLLSAIKSGKVKVE